ISLAVLIFYIHHVARSIQAQYVIASVRADLDDAIEEWFPRQVGRPARHREQAARDAPCDNLPSAALETVHLHAQRSGYIQGIDADAVMHAAREADVVLVLLGRP